MSWTESDDDAEALHNCHLEIERLKAELTRLRAIEKAARSWLAQLDANKDPQMLYEADVALALRDMLSSRCLGGEK